MARVKATGRRSQGLPKPRNQHFVTNDANDANVANNMSTKRPAEHDVGESHSRPKTARTSSGVGGVGGSAASAASSQKAPAPTTAAASAASSQKAPAPTTAAASAASSQKDPATTAAAHAPVPSTVSALAAASADTDTLLLEPTYRCFMQIYVLDVPWNPTGVHEAWMHMDLDNTHVRFDLSSGLNLLFHEDHFKIIPYGPLTTVVLNADMCGFDIAPGYSMRWQYDHMFHYHYDSRKRAFMIARLPTYKPNPPPFNRSDSPLIDAAMRSRFKNMGAPNLTTPCWFPFSQAERQRDYWKALYEGKKRAHDKLRDDYHNIDEMYTELEKELQETQAKGNALEKDLDETQAKMALQKAALEQIDKALECAVCLQRFSSTGPSVMASCGHVVHIKCKLALEAQNTADHCVECRASVEYWQEFRGFTDISQAVTTLHTALPPA